MYGLTYVFMYASRPGDTVHLRNITSAGKWNTFAKVILFVGVLRSEEMTREANNNRDSEILLALEQR